ncbi:DUF1826 domain-containing protein [Sphingomonas sp. CJ20]
MSAFETIVRAPCGIAAERADPAILDLAGRPHVHLALWNRRLPGALGWLAELDWSTIADLDFVAALDALPTSVEAALVEAGYPPSCGVLRNEIVALARRFAAILSVAAVAIRLEVVETDACRKFHADYVTARLLTTLVGPGTQWVLGDPEGAGPIRQMRTGDVAIFKGVLAADPPGILHRSPPIAQTGETRLLLAIDPAPLADR